MMRLATSLAFAVAMGFPVIGHGQSLLDRPPNLSGDWTGASGTLYFHFVHRFTTSDAPERKVSNVPTFLVAAGLPRRLLAGFNYSTNSTLAPRFPNEWELFARWMPLSQDYSAPLDLSAQVGYNNASDGVDAEVSIARKFGITRAVAAGRALSDPFEEGNTRLMSPVCTHAGCIVQWNLAERTWDCPCHGGRYHADGRVLCGPPAQDLGPGPE